MSAPTEEAAVSTRPPVRQTDSIPARRRPRGAARLLTAAAVGAAMLLAPATAAGADPGFQHATFEGGASLADGVCGGPVWGAAQTGENIPGQVHFYVRGTFFGVSSAPGRSCRVDTTVTWRNLDTGATGTVHGPVGKPWYPAFDPDPVGLQISETVATGPGRIELTATTALPHLPARAVITAY